MKKPTKCLDCPMPAVFEVKGVGGLCQKHANDLLVAALLCREHNKQVAKKKKDDDVVKRTKKFIKLYRKDFDDLSKK
jgi:hypothetical protein